MRFNGHRFIGCRWCGGRGCLQCEAEAAAAYRREFPEGPKPLATFQFDSPEDMERLRTTLGAEALKKTFGPGGGGMAELEAKLRGESPARSR